MDLQGRVLGREEGNMRGLMLGVPAGRLHTVCSREVVRGETVLDHSGFAHEVFSAVHAMKG